MPLISFCFTELCLEWGISLENAHNLNIVAMNALNLHKSDNINSSQPLPEDSEDADEKDDCVEETDSVFSVQTVPGIVKEMKKIIGFFRRSERAT